jgi:hypothetical protein
MALFIVLVYAGYAKKPRENALTFLGIKEEERVVAVNGT